MEVRWKVKRNIAWKINKCRVSCCLVEGERVKEKGWWVGGLLEGRRKKERKMDREIGRER